jgi:phosphinothricin acetyltransferase
MEIRAARPADAAALLEIYAPLVRETTISFEDVPPSVDEMARRIEGTLPRFPWLAMEDASGVLGYAYAARHRERAAYRWSVEVSAYVRSTARRRGVGRALYGALFAILERQGFRRAYAGITLPNEPSVRLHESVGFRAFAVYRGVGFKAGAWHDVGWWERELAAPGGAPADPTPFSELHNRGELATLIAAGSARWTGGPGARRSEE